MALTQSYLKRMLTTLRRGVRLYFLFYLYIYVGIPLIRAFDSQAHFPLFAQVLFYGGVWILFDAYRELSQVRTPPVYLFDAPARLCAAPARANDLRLRVSVRPGRISMGLPGLKRAPHRAVRFGRTRRR